ncbi:MAG: glutaredoxin 3 [Bdellovibrionales bacterium]|nr:glutaredoxin 3 [Bdellovibrionales bacterium]
MAKVEIYTTTFCPYCIRAKALLDSKGVSYTETDLQGRPQELSDLKKRTGHMTVPQIFINGTLVGGFSELRALEDAGELDRLLSRS